MKPDWKIVIAVVLGVIIAFVGVKLVAGYLPADAQKYVPSALKS